MSCSLRSLYSILGHYTVAVAGKPLAQQPTVEWRLPPKGDFVLISTEVGQFVIG